MRYIVCLLLVVLSSAAGARPYTVTSETTISNDNWYPLSEQEMKAATVDAALSEFTSNGRFEIIPDADQSRPPPDGALNFNISLIGPAEVVKLTTRLSLDNNATFISSVSMNIHGLDYQGIYNAFEFVGAESAKRLNAKMAMLHNADKRTNSVNPAPGSHKTDAAQLFNQAQQLKRQEQMREARALFETVMAQSPDTEWSTMAADELRYGLPIFEADNLMLNNALQEPLQVLQKMETVTLLYRQILADNTDNPQRVVDMNRRLDGMSLGLKQLKNAVKASAMSQASVLRVMLMEYCMESGEWPDSNTLLQLLGQPGPAYEVVSYQRSRGHGELVIKDVKYDVVLQLDGNMQGIRVQAK